jgi:hypothetical protein
VSIRVRHLMNSRTFPSHGNAGRRTGVWPPLPARLSVVWPNKREMELIVGMGTAANEQLGLGLGERAAAEEHK